MSKSEWYFVVFVVVSLLALLVHQYIFSIYEVEYTVSSHVLYLDANSRLTITSVPVNSLGFRAPFRNSFTKFSIVQGKELVEIVEANYESGLLVLRPKNEPGTVIVRAKSKYSLLPTEFEIKILRNLA